MVAGAIEPNRPVPQTSNRSTPQAKIAAVNSTGMAFSKNRAAPAMPANRAPRLVGRCRGELRDEAFERLVSLLGEIGIKPRDLLRLGHECLIGGLREFGMHFNRLVQRLHAGQLLD